jgi:hypothetical protein
LAILQVAVRIRPEPVRVDIDNEMGKNHRAQADKFIRDHVAGKFLSKALTYWNSVDMELKQAEMAAQRKTAASRPIVGERNVSENERFCFS